MRNQLINLILLKPQPVHPRVEFDMHTHCFLAGSLVSFHGFFQLLQDPQIIDLRFQVVFQQSIQTVFLGTHDHDRQMDPCFPQFNTFIRIRNRKIIHPVVLQEVSDLKTPAAV